MKKLSVVNEYDLTFAILARQVMCYERYTDFSSEEDLNDHISTVIWQPTKKFLERLEKTKPKQVTYFFSKPFNPQKKAGCKCQDIYIIDHQNKVAYFGTVFNKNADIVDIEYFSRRLSEPEIRHLKKNPLRIRRDATYYVIPSNKEELDIPVLIESIRRYLQSYAHTNIPTLAQAKVCFLSPDMGAKLDDAIRRQAKEQAQA